MSSREAAAPVSVVAIAADSTGLDTNSSPYPTGVGWTSGLQQYPTDFMLVHEFIDTKEDALWTATDSGATTKTYPATTPYSILQLVTAAAAGSSSHYHGLTEALQPGSGHRVRQAWRFYVDDASAPELAFGLIGKTGFTSAFTLVVDGIWISKAAGSKVLNLNAARDAASTADYTTVAGLSIATGWNTLMIESSGSSEAGQGFVQAWLNGQPCAGLSVSDDIPYDEPLFPLFGIKGASRTFQIDQHARYMRGQAGTA